MVMPFRFFWVALPYARRQLGSMVRWTFSSREHYNHSYHLTARNKQYLASYIAVISGCKAQVIENYIAELEGDKALRETLERCTRESRERFNCDVEPRYGRRLGWYALVRATKPRVVLETGVDRGLGTAVIAAALKRNTEEGAAGLVYATDIVPTCGHLLAEPYKSYCRILLGDSVASLKAFGQPVDIFIHDSDHRPEYEWAEFVAIEHRLHPGSLVMSDNSRFTSKLLEFGQRRGADFLFFQDEPEDHWWPGDGIGTVFRSGVKSYFPDIKESGAAAAKA